jgi:ParB/RepB/Spo0J family partition protein
MRELTESVRVHGVLNGLTVNYVTADGCYCLVAGGRRLRAAGNAGLDTVPCVIYTDLSAQGILEIMITENLLRKDLNPIEEAKGFRRLLDAGVSQTDLSSRLGISQPQIANRLRLLDAPEELQDLIVSRKITPGHLLGILAHKDIPVFDDYVLFLCDQYGTEWKNFETGPPTVREYTEDVVLGHFAGTVIDEWDDPGSVYSGVYRLPSSCKECPKLTKDNIEYGPYCFYPECFTVKIAEEKERKSSVESSSSSDPGVPTSWQKNDWIKADFSVPFPGSMEKNHVEFYPAEKSDHGFYRPLSWGDEPCRSCDKHILDVDVHKCLDPQCFKAKCQKVFGHRKELYSKANKVLHEAVRESIAGSDRYKLISGHLDNFYFPSGRGKKIHHLIGKDLDVQKFNDCMLDDRLRIVAAVEMITCLEWSSSDFGVNYRKVSECARKYGMSLPQELSNTIKTLRDGLAAGPFAGTPAMDASMVCEDASMDCEGIDMGGSHE